MAYYRDTEVELRGTFKDAAGALKDPTDVVLEVLSPAKVKTTYTYGAAELTKESTGVYAKAVVLDESGTWHYRYKGTGAVTVAGWKDLPVLDDPLG